MRDEFAETADLSTLSPPPRLSLPTCTANLITASAIKMTGLRRKVQKRLLDVPNFPAFRLLHLRNVATIYVMLLLTASLRSFVEPRGNEHTVSSPWKVHFLPV
jgi:hypothetical protein